MADIEADVIIVGSGISGALARSEAVGGGRQGRHPRGRRQGRSRRGAASASGTRRSGCLNAPIRRAPRPITRSATIPTTGTGRSGRTSSRAPISRWSAARRGIGSAPAFASCRTIFACSTAYGRGLDWPIGYDDLEPFYGEAEREIGVSGDSDETLGSPRSAAYPMPAHPADLPRQGLCAGARRHANSRFARRRRRATRSIATSGLPVAAMRVASRSARSRRNTTRPCICRWRRRAARSLHAQTTATMVEVGADGRVTAIRFKRWDGSEGVATSARSSCSPPTPSRRRGCCLHSRSDATPNGRRQQLRPGRPQSHGPSDAAELGARAARRCGPIADRSRPRASRISATARSARTGPPSASRSAMTAGRGRKARRSRPPPTSRGRACAARRSTARCATRRPAISASPPWSSSLPDPDNRVTLDPNDMDMYGVPLPRLAYRLDAYVEAGLAAARAAHAEIFGRLGATEIQHRDAPKAPGTSSARRAWATIRRVSVVDRDLRSHDHRNLFILGSAVFPTGATANPTLDHRRASLARRRAGQSCLDAVRVAGPYRRRGRGKGPRTVGPVKRSQGQSKRRSSMVRVDRHRPSRHQRRRFRKIEGLLRAADGVSRLRHRGRVRRQHDGLGQRQDAVLDRRGRRRRQEAQIPQGRHRLSPLRLPPAQPEGCRCAAGVSRGAGRRPSSIPPASITTTITPCSFSIPTA